MFFNSLPLLAICQVHSLKQRGKICKTSCFYMPPSSPHPFLVQLSSELPLPIKNNTSHYYGNKFRRKRSIIQETARCDTSFIAILASLILSLIKFCKQFMSINKLEQKHKYKNDYCIWKSNTLKSSLSPSGKTSSLTFSSTNSYSLSI